MKTTGLGSQMTEVGAKTAKIATKLRMFVTYFTNSLRRLHSRRHSLSRPGSRQDGAALSLV